MLTHPVVLEVKHLMRAFPYIHTLCMPEANVLTRQHWYDKCQNLVCLLICFLVSYDEVLYFCFFLWRACMIVDYMLIGLFELWFWFNLLHVHIDATSKSANCRKENNLLFGTISGLYLVYCTLADSLKQTMNRLLLLRHKQIGTRSKCIFLFAYLFFVA